MVGWLDRVGWIMVPGAWPSSAAARAPSIADIKTAQAVNHALCRWIPQRCGWSVAPRASLVRENPSPGPGWRSALVYDG